MNPYETLGVDLDANIDAINAAYRRKARSAHPDAGGAPGDMERLNEAVAILRNPQARAHYDQTGETKQAAEMGLSVAVELLVQTFQEALAHAHDHRRVDVIALTKTRLKAKLRDIEANEAAGRREHQRLLRLVERMTHKGDAPPFLIHTVQNQAAAVLRQLETADSARDMVNKAIELADGYEWKVDPAPADAPAFQFVRGGPTGTYSTTTL